MQFDEAAAGQCETVVWHHLVSTLLAALEAGVVRTVRYQAVDQADIEWLTHPAHHVAQRAQVLLCKSVNEITSEHSQLTSATRGNQR